MRTAHSRLRLVCILLDLAQDALQFLLLGTRSGTALKAENIFLRKQLALYLERQATPRRATGATRLSMVLLSRLFAWQNALINVKPETFLGWQRKGFQLLWRSKSRPRGWTKQQFREVMMDEQSYRFVLHDRDRIYSSELDSALKAMDLKVLKTPFQAPQANAFCERLIGTVRRECLDFLIPLNERHLRSLLKEWVTHYNRGRPHASLGPGIPDLRSGQQQARLCGHRIPIDHQVVAKAILGGLHHEYSLERRAA